MRKLALASALAVGLFVGAPAPAKADQACIEGCNRDFPGSDPVSISIRGWCYIIRNCIAEE